MLAPDHHYKWVVIAIGSSTGFTGELVFARILGGVKMHTWADTFDMWYYNKAVIRIDFEAWTKTSH